MWLTLANLAMQVIEFFVRLTVAVVAGSFALSLCKVQQGTLNTMQMKYALSR